MDVAPPGAASSSSAQAEATALSISGPSSVRAAACWTRTRACVEGEVQYVQARRRAQSLASLHRYPSLLLLAAWHSYGVWMAFCAIVCMAGNTFLTWYIGWYQLVPSHQDGPFPYFHFFAIFLRSWLLVAVSSELCRFCYLFFLDMWALDAFGGYRRALCGLATVDMWSQQAAQREGQWPHTILRARRVRRLDCVVQWLVYASFDVAPVAAGAWSYATAGIWGAQVAAFKVLLSVALTHVLLYYVAWLVTDVAQKYQSFNRAWSADHGQPPNLPQDGELTASFGGLRHADSVERQSPERGSDNEAGDEAHSTSEPRCSFRRIRCCRNMGLQRRLVSVQELWSSNSRPALSTAEQEVNLRFLDKQSQTEAGVRDVVAEELNQCVKCCGWVDVALWEAFFIAALVACIVAAVVLKTLLYMTLCLVGAFVLLFWRCRWAFAQEPWEQTKLQRWGESKCSLEHWDRWSAHTAFGLVLILQAALFGYAQQWPGLWVCVGMIGLVLLREWGLNWEKNNGWWIGVVEGLGIWIAVCGLNLSLLGPSDCLHTFVLALLHQFGLQRSRPSGARLVKVVFALMYAVLVIIVGATLLSVTPAEESNWSAFAPGGKNFTIHHKDVKGRGVICEGRYSTGRGGTTLSLADFGLFSALAYESNASMPAVLDHYFPGWKVLHSRVASSNHVRGPVQADWTTFFEFGDPSNTTSVIAIRGTDSTLDVLSDVNLWLTAALLEGFELLGPAMLASVSQAVSSWSTIVRGDDGQEHFAELLKYVTARLHDTRQFYITGHSLGGGLAKLVASQVNMQAVTFMAPGEDRTRWNVFQSGAIHGGLIGRSLTVQPEHDLVSRVDGQVGSVMPTKCDKDPLTCHSIYEAAICPLFSLCGSMRKPGQDLVLPCSQCPAMCLVPVDSSLG